MSKLFTSDSPCFVIAEIGFNHGGDIALARSMIEAAAAAGADAVKFQSYLASDLCFEEAPHYQLIKQGEMDLSQHRYLAAAAQESGVTFLSTPFSQAMADILAEVGVPAYKVASMDVTNLPLLAHIARMKKPILLSTGMATLPEIAVAIETIRKCSEAQLVLLHCISHYPTSPEQVNLRTIAGLREAFKLEVGFSDHTLGNAAAVSAVALGARVIEKHFTTDKNLAGPDHKISADPAQLADLVKNIREAEASLGRSALDESRADRMNAAPYRRGLYAARDIAEGSVLTADMLHAVRPETELKPGDAGKLVGRKTRRQLRRAAAISPDGVA